MTAPDFSAPPASTVRMDLPAPLDRGVDLARMMRLVWAGKWVLAAWATALVLAAGYYGFAIASPRHQAVVVLDITATTSARNQAEVLQSDALLGAVIAQLDLGQDPAFNRYLRPPARFDLARWRGAVRDFLSGQTTPPPDAAQIAAKTVQNLRAKLHITPIAGSDLLRLSVTTGDGARAVELANALARAYLAAQVRARQDQLQRQQDWLAARLAALRGDLATAQTQIATLALPDAASLNAQAQQRAATGDDLAAARAALARLNPASTTPADRANAARLAGQIAGLERQQAQQAAALADQNARIAQAQHWAAQADGLRADIALFGAQLQAAQVSASQIAPDAQIINPALAAQYIGPQKLLLVQIAALTGLLAGLAQIALRHQLRTGFEGGAELAAATGLPVLAQISDSAPQAGDAQLRNALLLRMGAAAQVIVISAAHPRAGKTATAMALARGLGRLGKRVLLVDADLTADSRGSGALGLAQVLGGTASLPLARQVSAGADGVDLLPAGDAGRAGSDLLMQGRLAGVLAQARRDYDVIVLDAPAVDARPDACVLARHADLVLLVVRARLTSAKALAGARAQLASAQITLDGLALITD